MNIAIIGAGAMGANLARLFARAGYGVALADNGSGKAATTARELGAAVQAGSVVDAIESAEIVVYAAPFAAAGDIVKSNAAALAGKILIDISNPISGDYMSLTIGHTTSAAEELQRLAPGAKVVKAFNTILAQVLGEGPAFGAQRAQVFIAGDDVASKAIVQTIVARLGFDALDAGSLTNARYLEPIAEQNIHFAYALGQGVQIAPIWIKRAA